MRNKSAWLLVIGLLMLSGFACSSKGNSGATTGGDAIDHYTAATLVPPKDLVHRTFPVKRYAKFEFVVPPHIHNPRLRGNFNAFVKANGAAAAVGQRADISLLLLDEEEFEQFAQGQGGAPTNAAGPSDSQQVEWGLTSTFDEPSKYYLVFVNPAGGRETRFVQSDFTVSFE